MDQSKSNSFIYEGDTNWYDTNSLLYDVVFGCLVLTIITELFRGIVHGIFPYESHTKISGLANALSLEGSSLDAVAQMTSIWGMTSIILAFMYAQPLIFGDPMGYQAIYVLSITYLLRTLQGLNFTHQIFAPIQTFQEFGFEPPGKKAYTIQKVITTIALSSGVALLYN